jgi:hypothetical protein
MDLRDDQREKGRLSDNLQRGIELTELALALRLAMLHEIRVAKERAWQANQT